MVAMGHNIHIHFQKKKKTEKKRTKNLNASSTSAAASSSSSSSSTSFLWSSNENWGHLSCVAQNEITKSSASAAAAQYLCWVAGWHDFMYFTGQHWEWKTETERKWRWGTVVFVPATSGSSLLSLSLSHSPSLINYKRFMALFSISMITWMQNTQKEWQTEIKIKKKKKRKERKNNKTNILNS